MRIASKILALPFVAMTLLAGCAGFSGTTMQKVTLTVYAASDLSTGSGGSDLVPVGQTYPLRHHLLSVADCGDAKTACSRRGEGKVPVNVIIQKVEAGEVTLKVVVISDIRGSQKVDNGPPPLSGAVAMATVPAGFEVIEDTEFVPKTATMPMGEFRRISLRHGINLDVCVEQAEVYRGSVETKCDILKIESGAIRQATIPVL